MVTTREARALVAWPKFDAEMLFDTLGRTEVQKVEDVVRINPELNPGILAEYRQLGQAKTFRSASNRRP